jgi:hypothetical protein
VTFISEKRVKAVRKAKPCEGCRKVIQIGERAVRYVGIEDGFYSSLYHPECRRAEVKLNDIHDTRWDDEDWMRLDDMDWEDWPWLIAECPLVAVRLGITTAKYEEIRAERERVSAAWRKIDADRLAAKNGASA